MTPQFTQDANLRNKKLASDGMVFDCALRNHADMSESRKENGLRAARDRLGVNQDVMAERLGVSIAQISRWEKGRNSIPGKRVKDVMSAYQATFAELFGEMEAPAVVSSIPEANARPVHFEGASLERMTQDVPILGTALGVDRLVDSVSIEQTSLFLDEVIGYAKRPVILDGRVDVYGIYVQGSSMYPAFGDGQLIFVESKRQPSIGEDVIVYLRKNGDDDEGDDGHSARTVLVKRLVRRSHSYLELEQFNPSARFMIDTRDVLKYHRVIPYTELLS